MVKCKVVTTLEAYRYDCLTLCHELHHGAKEASQTAVRARIGWASGSAIDTTKDWIDTTLEAHLIHSCVLHRQMGSRLRGSCVCPSQGRWPARVGFYNWHQLIVSFISGHQSWGLTSRRLFYPKHLVFLGRAPVGSDIMQRMLHFMWLRFSRGVE